jgi:hypothetical protein
MRTKKKRKTNPSMNRDPSKALLWKKNFLLLHLHHRLKIIQNDEQLVERLLDFFEKIKMVYSQSS